MKKCFSTISLVSICLLYLTAYTGLSYSVQVDAAGNAPEGRESNAQIAVLSTSHLFFPVQAYKSISTFYQTPPSSGKKYVERFSAFVKSTQKTNFGIFSQYFARSTNFLIRFRKANIIFPYHYFW